MVLAYNLPSCPSGFTQTTWRSVRLATLCWKDSRKVEPVDLAFRESLAQEGQSLCEETRGWHHPHFFQYPSHATKTWKAGALSQCWERRRDCYLAWNFRE